MTIQDADIPPFDRMSFFEVLLTEEPALFPVAERSPSIRNLALARADGKKLREYLRMETARAWFELWQKNREDWDTIPDVAANIPLHRFAHEGYPFQDESSRNVSLLFRERFSSVFEMFDISEYEELFTDAAGLHPAEARLTYQLVAPLRTFRPSVTELSAVPPGNRRAVTTLLQPGFGVHDAWGWVQGRIRSSGRRLNELETDRQRYAALALNGVPSAEAARLVHEHPLREVSVLLSAHQNGIPVDYMEEL